MQRERKQLNIADTNLALMGSKMDHQMRLERARAEDAFKGAGQRPGLEVWRIEKFHVVPWPTHRYGQFYDQDSYIVLHTEKKGDSLMWDIYFWLGQYTSADEAGTAAFKTVELDEVLGSAAVQHREVQMHESADFSALWPKGIKILEGGIESGFNDVDAGEAGKLQKKPPKLYLVSGPTMKTVRISTLSSVSLSHLSEEDCFVLDSGAEDLFLYRGANASPGETAKGGRFANELADERPNGEVRFCSADSAPDLFWSLLGGKGKIKAMTDDASKNRANAPSARTRAFAFGGRVSDDREPSLIHVTDKSGKLEFTTIATGRGMMGKHLNPNDVYILVESDRATSWVGRGASSDEKRAALGHMSKVMEEIGNPYAQVNVIKEGREPPYFQQMLRR